MAKKTSVKQISFSTEYLDVLDIVNSQPNSSRYVCEAIKFFEKYKNKDIEVALALYNMNIQPSQVNVQQNTSQNILNDTISNTEHDKGESKPVKPSINIGDRLNLTKKMSF